MTVIAPALAIMGVVALLLAALGAYARKWGAVSEEELKAQENDGFVWLPIKWRSVLSCLLMSAGLFAGAAVLWALS